MSILNEELEERYPIEEGDCITLTREQLALQLRRAYKAGATRDYKRTRTGIWNCWRLSEPSKTPTYCLTARTSRMS